MTHTSARDFFISYNHRDTSWAEWIAWQLEATGYTTYIQAWDFHVGSNFVIEMDKASKEAERTIVVLSPNYFESDFTPSEWAATFSKDPKGLERKLLPVRVGEVRIEGLLSSVVFIDIVGKTEREAVRELLARIRKERGKPTRPPRFPGSSVTPDYPGKETAPEDKQIEYMVVFSGTIGMNDRAMMETLLAHLRKFSGDASLTIQEVRKGSIELSLKGDGAGFERLLHMFEAGYLLPLDSFRVIKVTKSNEQAESRVVRHNQAFVLFGSTLKTLLYSEERFGPYLRNLIDQTESEDLINALSVYCLGNEERRDILSGLVGRLGEVGMTRSDFVKSLYVETDDALAALQRGVIRDLIILSLVGQYVAYQTGLYTIARQISAALKFNIVADSLESGEDKLIDFQDWINSLSDEIEIAVKERQFFNEGY